MRKKTVQTIKLELVKLSLLFPEAGYTADQLDVIAPYYLKAFEDKGDESFKACVKYAIENCRFFPKVSDLMEAWEHVQQQLPPSSHKMITEKPVEITEEEAQANVEKVKILGQIASKEITAEEGVYLISKIKAFGTHGQNMKSHLHGPS